MLVERKPPWYVGLVGLALRLRGQEMDAIYYQPRRGWLVEYHARAGGATLSYHARDFRGVLGKALTRPR